MRLHLNHRRFNLSVIASTALATVIVLPLTGYWWNPKPQDEGPSQPRVLFSLKGRISTFGGSADSFMGRADMLAMFKSRSEAAEPEGRDYFIWPPPPGITGTLRQLDPEKFYVACRWDYDKASKEQLRESLVTVTNPANGKIAKAKPVDWGPHASTGRVADISPGLAEFLDVKTDEVVVISFESPQ